MTLSREFLDQLGSVARSQLTDAGLGRWEDKGIDLFDPVTKMDRAIEQAMRASIQQAFPDDAILGEEFGWTGQGARRTWSLDPIDGTRAFICDLPSWAVLVGVIEDGEHVAGMIDLPALDERVIALDGVTLRNGVASRTSGCRDLQSARLSTTDPDLFSSAELNDFERLRSATLVTRFGLDAMAYARLATGGIDLVIESGLKRFDLDALVAVVRGAGGAIGDWSGGSDWDQGRILAAATRELYDEAVALLAA